MTDTQPDPSTDAARKAVWERYATRLLGAMALTALAVGTVAYKLLEDWSWVDSFYFSAVALTTVGFGDISPTTDASKIFTVLYIFGGVSLIGAYLNELTKRHALKMSKRRGPDSDQDA